ncbi:MAG: RnfABCDGE type electron transport complex subunit B [Oscillospiraceae bacterium]|nr:RnfABCDGE type electron transport complex subunit B [Oscillospiraceae bacterium]
MNILWAVIWFLVLGFGFGLILAFAGKIFAVETDERADIITHILPGANCGGCGYTNCAVLAESIVKGKAKTGACPVGGAETASKIAEIMREQSETDTANIRYRAQVMCSGTNDLSRKKYEYQGITDCISASRLAGGSKACPNGCLGLGTCVKNCKFDAIKVINGVAAVDYEKCRACGACTFACPKKIIKLIPFDSAYWVGCMSADKGAVTRKYCNVGCIACGLCEKKCPTGAIKIDDFVASIDYGKCINCGECEKVCPRRVIWSNVSQKNDGIVRDKNSVKARSVI